MQEFNFLISDDENTSFVNTRIDNFLVDRLNVLQESLNISRSRVQKLIDESAILVNGISTTKNYKLRLNDSILVSIQEPKTLDIVAQDIFIDIAYEDKDVIIVNKPQNMVVHPANGHEDGTLVNALMYHCGEDLSGINGVIRAGIVHRIDKDTSGLLIVAKNDNAHTSLAKQLEEHSMNRIYYAVVYNNLKEDTGTIDAPIGRHPKDRKKMAVVYKNSKRAVTHYEVLERYKKFTLIKLKLETGRTHQIRVHMAHIGNPLLGDFIYGKEKQPYNLKGQMLHSKILGFVHPVSGEYVEVESDLPSYFLDVINKIKN